MEQITFFWWAQPDIARDFLRILVLLFIASFVRLIFSLVRIYRGGVPRSIFSAVQGKLDASAAVYKSIASAEEAFNILSESTMADVGLVRVICTLMIVLSLMMVGFSGSRVYDDCLRAPRLTDVQCTFLAAVHLFELMGVGLTFCAILWTVTNAIEYLLQTRKMIWRRVLVDAKRALSDMTD